MGYFKELQIELMDHREQVRRIAGKEPEDITDYRDALMLLKIVPTFTVKEDE